MGDFLVGGSNHIQHREFFAVVSDQKLSASDFTKGGLGDTLEGSLFKLSDSGYGSRLTSLPAQNDALDPLTITGHGRINNGTVGALNNQVRFSNEAGFGLDNGPDGEGAARFLNAGDSLTFTLNQDNIRTFTFIAHADANSTAETSTILFDFDGNVIADGLYGASQNLANKDAALELVVPKGATVDIDFDTQVLKVNGVVQTGADIEAFFFEAGAPEALTVGALGGEASRSRTSRSSATRSPTPRPSAAPTR